MGGILDANGSVACAECARNARDERDSLMREVSDLKALVQVMWYDANRPSTWCADTKRHIMNEMLRLGMDIG